MVNEAITENKQILLKVLAKHTRILRGKKSQFMLCSENDISVSIISMIERALKDPQLTTVFKIAQALGISTSEFIRRIEKDLPEDFSLIDL